MARMTRAAADRIRAELDELRGPGRAAAQQALQDARAAGKMEENSDYWLADEARNRLEERIAHLTGLLADAHVTDSSVTDTSRVADGCIVDITFDGDDETERYYVGTRVAAPEGLDAISLDSPLGQALVGAQVGEQVSYTLPTGTRLTVTVTAIAAA